MDSLNLPFVLFQVVSPKTMDNLSLLLSCFKWLVLNNEQLEYLLSFCQVVSPKQRAS